MNKNSTASFLCTLAIGILIGYYVTDWLASRNAERRAADRHFRELESRVNFTRTQAFDAYHKRIAPVAIYALDVYRGTLFGAEEVELKDLADKTSAPGLELLRTSVRTDLVRINVALAKLYRESGDAWNAKYHLEEAAKNNRRFNIIPGVTNNESLLAAVEDRVASKIKN
jgi:hypothetical protein